MLTTTQFGNQQNLWWNHNATNTAHQALQETCHMTTCRSMRKLIYAPTIAQFGNQQHLWWHHNAVNNAAKPIPVFRWSRPRRRRLVAAGRCFVCPISSICLTTLHGGVSGQQRCLQSRKLSFTARNFAAISGCNYFTPNTQAGYHR